MAMMKTRRRSIAAVVLLTFLPATVSFSAVTLNASPAQAQPADDPVTVQARARFKEGVEAFDKGKYEEARLAFLQAYTLKKHPAVLLNLAQSSAKSNHPLEAAKYFSQFLREATSATPQQKKDAEQGLAEVRKNVARIEVVAPAGTDISLDDQGKVGTTPFEALDVEPGQHTVKSPTQNVTVIAVVGQKVEARFGNAASSPAVVPVTAPPASSSSSSPPPNNTDPGWTPPPGGDKGHSKKTDLLSPPENMTPVYIGLAVAGIGVVSAIVFAAFKADAQSKAEKVAADIRNAAQTRNIPAQGACNSTAPGAADLQNACKTLRDNNSKVDTNATIANVSIGVAIAGGVFALGWYLLATKKDESKTGAAAPDTKTAKQPQRPELRPYAGWQSGGLSLTGEF